LFHDGNDLGDGAKLWTQQLLRRSISPRVTCFLIFFIWQEKVIFGMSTNNHCTWFIVDVPNISYLVHDRAIQHDQLKNLLLGTTIIPFMTTYLLCSRGITLITSEWWFTK